MFGKLDRWLTPQRRQAIQVFFGSLAPLAILFGLGTENLWSTALVILGAVLQFFASLLSLVNVRLGDWSQGWAIVRAAVYSLAMVVSPALALLGVYDEALNGLILSSVSLGLASLSGLVAIFTSSHQQLETAEAHHLRDHLRGFRSDER